MFGHVATLIRSNLRKIIGQVFFSFGLYPLLVAAAYLTVVGLLFLETVSVPQ